MRLNKTLREGILANWHNDKWKKRIDDALAEFIQTHREQFEASVARDIQTYNEFKHLAESGYLRTSSRFKFRYIEIMNHTPPALRRHFMHDHDRSIACATYANGGNTHVEVELDPNAVKRFAKIAKLSETQADDLTSIVYGCTTVDKLIELVPGIEKYIPKKHSAAALPVPMDTVNRVKAFI